MTFFHYKIRFSALTLEYCCSQESDDEITKQVENALISEKASSKKREYNVAVDEYEVVKFLSKSRIGTYNEINFNLSL